MNEGEDRNCTFPTFSFSSPHNPNSWQQYKGTEQEEHPQEAPDHDIWNTSRTFIERMGGSTGKGEELAKGNDPTVTFLPVW